MEGKRAGTYVVRSTWYNYTTYCTYVGSTGIYIIIHHSWYYQHHHQHFLVPATLVLSESLRSTCWYLYLIKDCDKSGRPLAEPDIFYYGGSNRKESSLSSASSSTGFNASCHFPEEEEDEEGGPLESTNIVVFHGDRELSRERGVQHFEPGAELVYRCVDIGEGRMQKSGQGKQALSVSFPTCQPFNPTTFLRLEESR